MALPATLVPALAAATPLALGYDTYSIRSWSMKAMAHLDFAAKHKLDAIQLSSLSDFESLEQTHLAKVRQRAAELGIILDAGTGCICPSARAWRPANGDPNENLAKAIRVAARNWRPIAPLLPGRLGRPIGARSH